MKFNARFNLRKQSSREPEIIYLICRIDGFKFVYNAGFKVMPKHWDIRAEKIRNINLETNRDFINDYLTKLRGETKRIYESAILNREPLTKEYLKNGLDLWTGRKRKETITLFSWLETYILDSTTRINPRTGRTISHRTIQEYRTTQKYLVEFSNTLDYKLDFDTADIHTLNDFRDFLTTVKGFAVNNIAKHLNNVRQFFRAATTEKKVTIDPDLINPNGFKVAKEKPQDIYLTESDLKALLEIDFSDKSQSITIKRPDTAAKPEKVGFATLDKVRDLFIVGCWTGLRVSDFNDLKPYHFAGDYIVKNQYKTGAPVTIPIMPVIREMHSKYSGNFPRIAPSKINRCIKAICKVAGLSEQVEKQRTKAGTRKTEIFEKWQLVSSHTARRSFATNMVRRGYSTRQIMAITGHQKESVFLNYIKLSSTEHAEILRKQITG